MTYKKGMSKTKFKNKMRNFWTDRWKYERSPEDWIEVMIKNTNNFWGERPIELLEGALNKLVLEKKIDKTQCDNLLNMIKSPDKENALVALHVMAQLKPKKFKKVENNEQKTRIGSIR